MAGGVEVQLFAIASRACSYGTAVLRPRRSERLSGAERGMQTIIEVDGVLLDLRSAYYVAHRKAAEEVGWAHLSEAEFWSTLRKHGHTAPVLRGAKPIKQAQYADAFAQRLESEEALAELRAQPAAVQLLRILRGDRRLSLVTLGQNIAARQAALDRAGLRGHDAGLTTLNADPRRRAGELSALGGGDSRAIVVAASDVLLRAAGSANLMGIGVSSGACAPNRLHQAGASVVFPDAAALVEAILAGSAQLARVGIASAGARDRRHG